MSAWWIQPDAAPDGDDLLEFQRSHAVWLRNCRQRRFLRQVAVTAMVVSPLVAVAWWLR